MALEAGRRLGPYEVLAPLGAGGMGEVYRGRDTRVGRTVAIKVLPSDVAGDAERRARFEREAHVIASLNHPHICALHDVGSQDGTDFFVMEHLDGETLAARLARGPLPIDEALTLARQIADALDAAHSAGIVHRDLKPGNVMLVRSGAKLLDFGLARLEVVGLTDHAGQSLVATSPAPLTSAGSILGTLHYMAPEQLEGQPVDARADIFAFGAVLHEMVTGHRAFAGATTASVVGAILKDQAPPVSALCRGAPPLLDDVVRACLAKAPAERWQNARDLTRALTWVGNGAERAAAANVPTWRRWWIGGLVGMAVGAVAVAAIGWTRLGRTPETAHQRPARWLSVPLGPDESMVQTTRPSAGPLLDLSPDGRYLALTTAHEGSSRIQVRDLATNRASFLRGSDRGFSPFFSPDGAWVGYFSGDRISRTQLSTGHTVEVTRGSPVPRGATWLSADAIAYSFSYTEALTRIPVAGGDPEPLTTLASDSETNHLLPHALPGGTAVLYTAWKGGSFDDASTWIVDLRTRERRRILINSTNARYASGHVLFVRGGTLMAAPFDLARLEVTAPPWPLAEGVLTDSSTGTANFAVSGEGTLAYVAAPPGPRGGRILWLDRQGVPEPMLTDRRSYYSLRLSPDRTQIAASIDNDIWIGEVARGTFRRLTVSGLNQFPRWLPDGSRVVFSSTGGRPMRLLLANVDGSGTPEVLTEAGVVFDGSITPDGKTLVYSLIELPSVSTPSWDVMELSLEGDHSPRPVVKTQFNEYTPALSPDGRWLAFTSDVSGLDEVWVQPYGRPGSPRQVSAGGGGQIVWTPDGRELIYLSRDHVMSASVTSRGRADALVVAPPRALFRRRLGAATATTQWADFDVSGDGKRFLVVDNGDTDAQLRQVKVVVNWPSLSPGR